MMTNNESLSQNITPEANHRPVALSFFSGAMGLDLGLEKAGFEFRLACEADKTCQETIRANRPDLTLIDDVWKYNADDIRRLSGVTGDIDLIAGGPPCQAFSTIGKHRGFSDIRGNVFLYYIKLLLELRPRYIVIENVRGLLSAPLKYCPTKERANNENYGLLNKPGGALLYIIEKLREGGYTVSFNLYNAANFGVPQIRERVVIIATREGEKVPYLTPTHSENGEFGLPLWKTLRDALDGVQGCDHAEYPAWRIPFFAMLKGGQCWRHLPKDILPQAVTAAFWGRVGGKTGDYRRLSWDRPCCTLMTSPIRPSSDTCHPDELRPLSIQEFKRVQMFPDDWILAGKLDKQYRQVGNAVPTGFGFAIGRTIIEHMKGESAKPFPGFKYSRYLKTDETSWEAFAKKRLGLKPDEKISDQPGVMEMVTLMKDE